MIYVGYAMELINSIIFKLKKQDDKRKIDFIQKLKRYEHLG